MISLRDLYKFTFKEIPSPEFCEKLPVQLYPFYLKKIYKYRTGKKLDLKNPKTFCEKIQYLKLYDSTPLKTQCTDKILVRNYIVSKLCNKYLKPIFKIYDSFDEINFEELPEFFVLKTNHSWATTSARKKSLLSPSGIRDLSEFYNIKMKENFAFRSGFELQYKNIVPKIIVEKYIPKITQYCVLCINKEAEFIHVADMKKEGMASAWYNKDLKLQPFELISCEKQILPDIDIKVAQEAIQCSQKLCTDFSLVRCDFAYSKKYNRLYFEELTFTPNSGFLEFYPNEYEYKLGEKLNLCKK